MKDLQFFSDFAVDCLIIVSGASLLSMSIIQCWKKLLLSRQSYYRKMIWRWTTKKLFNQKTKESGGTKNKSLGTTIWSWLNDNLFNRKAKENSKIYEELLEIIIGYPQKAPTWWDLHFGFLIHRFRPRPENALFSLEINEMFERIEDAVLFSLGPHSKYKNLFEFATSSVDPNILEKCPKVGRGRKKSSEKPATIVEFLERSAIAKVEAAKLSMAYCWQVRNQFLALILGFSILLFLANTALFDGYSESFKFVFSLLGGIAAPVAKDLVGLVKNARGLMSGPSKVGVIT